VLQRLIRVELVLEHGRLRDHLRAIVRESDRIQVEPGTADDTRVESSAINADALVCDDTPGSLVRAQLAQAAGVPIVLVTDDPDVAASFRELRWGLALLPTTATTEEFVAAIEGAIAGLIVIHPSLSRRETPIPAAAEGPLEPLTAREIEVLHALAAGLGNRAIGAQLHISEHTAKFHVSQILAKLGAASRAEAVSIALRTSLLPV
jgi:DNA-binding NarL/FixJ family response regulator